MLGRHHWLRSPFVVLILRIDRLVNQGATHMILVPVVTPIYFALTIGARRVWPTLVRDQSLVWGLTIPLIAITFAPLRSRLQIIVDHLFYNGRYDYRTAMSEISHALNQITNTDDLAKILVRRLAEILSLKGAALLLPTDEETLTLAETVGWIPDANGPHVLPRTGAMCRALLKISHPATTPELQLALSATLPTAQEQAWLSRPDFDELEVWIPLIQSEKLQGVLLLSVRPSGEPFDEEDRRILDVLASQAAVVVANLQLLEALRQRTDEIGRLCLQLMQSREAERKRLARELHDQIIQDLINLHYHLDLNARPLSTTAEGQAQALRERLQSIIDNLRKVCFNLRPAALDDLSLDLAVQGYVEEFNAQYGLNVDLHLASEVGDPTIDLPEQLKLCVFRVLQEALTNVLRHAHASLIQVELAVLPDHVSLQVRDNGKGFQCPTNLSRLIGKGHFGLAGLQEWMNLVNGTLRIESAPGNGTTLWVRAPVIRESALNHLTPTLGELHTTPPPHASSRPIYQEYSERDS